MELIKKPLNFYERLDVLENLGGSNAKESYLIDILKHVKNAEPFFRFAFNDQVFGVKEQTFINAFFEDYAPEMNDWEHISDWFEEYRFPGDGNTTTITPITVPKLLEFGNELLTISGSFQEFRLKVFFTELSRTKRKWFCRAILKDLRCGVKVKTVNKAFRACGMPIIKKFSMQLCDKINVYDEEMVKKKITFPCTMECKYDGIRIQAEVWESSATLSTHATMTSRRGNDRTDKYPEIIEELKKRFAGQHVILDCEVIARSFQSLMTKDDTSEKKLIIWDILNDENLPYINRWDNLKSLAGEVGISAFNEQNDDITDLKDNQIINNNSKSLFTAEHYNANSLKEVQDYYSHLNERGEEGIIIKLDSRPYERDSRKHMFKCKKVLTADLKCIGYKLGEGKRSGKVGALELIDASGKITVDVGSGLTDDMVEELSTQIVYSNLTPYWIDKIVEIKYNEITETNSIRNPRFVCFRDDKDEADDLSQAEVRQA